MNDLICPYDYYEIETDECFETTQSSTTITQYYEGHCPHCNRRYQWEEKYYYSETCNIMEME